MAFTSLGLFYDLQSKSTFIFNNPPRLSHCSLIILSQCQLRECLRQSEMERKLSHGISRHNIQNGTNIEKMKLSADPYSNSPLVSLDK